MSDSNHLPEGHATQQTGVALPHQRLRRSLLRCGCALAAAGAWLQGCGGAGSLNGAAPASSPASLAGFTQDPERAPIHTSDLQRFAQVFEAQAPGFGGLEAALQRDYLDAGTAVLKGFAAARLGSATDLAQAIRANPAFYAGLVQGLSRFTDNPALTSHIRSGFLSLKAVLPGAWFSPTAFLVGRLSTGGTVVNEGIVMAVDLFSLSASTLAAAPNGFVRRNLREPASAALTVIHELAHVQQSIGLAFFNSSRRTLLETSLIEGGADWLADQCAGGHNPVTDEAWAAANEATLWREFQTEMLSTDLSRWAYNQNTLAAGRPGDLAYFVGRRICEAYAAKQPNASQAVQGVMRIPNALAFLQQSGYAGR